MTINGIEVVEDFIPLSKKARSGIRINPTYITVHNTGNSKEGANARMHTEYVDTTGRYVSWHFSVDDVSIYQEMPCTEKAIHSGSHKGNMSSIGIEICETGDYFKAEENAIALIKYLMKKYKIPYENVVSHQYWSGKYCPHIILDYGWDNFIKRLKGGMTVRKFQYENGLQVDGVVGKNTITTFLELAQKHKQLKMSYNILNKKYKNLEKLSQHPIRKIADLIIKIINKGE